MISFASVADTFDVTAVVLFLAVIGYPLAKPSYVRCSKCFVESRGGNWQGFPCGTVIFRSVLALYAVIAPAASNRSGCSSSVSESESFLTRSSLSKSSFKVLGLYSVGSFCFSTADLDYMVKFSSCEDFACLIGLILSRVWVRLLCLK